MIDFTALAQCSANRQKYGFTLDQIREIRINFMAKKTIFVFYHHAEEIVDFTLILFIILIISVILREVVTWESQIYNEFSSKFSLIKI
jgi:hypothetical protein